MGKIKIVRIIARLNIGGPAKHVTILSEELDRARYESTLLYGNVDRGEGDMSYLLKADTDAVVVSELSRSINPLGDLAAFAKIYSIIRREKPHIIHTHTAKAGTIGRLAAIMARVPIKVHTFHGHVFYGYFNRLLTEYFLWIERLLARFTDRIIAISDDQKEELLAKYKIGKEDKYSVVNIGLDLKPFLSAGEKKGALRDRLGIKKDDIVIGIIGRLAPVKNHMMFMRVARRVMASAQRDLSGRLKFIVVGDGPEREALEKYVETHGLGKVVIFTGWIKYIEEAYADIDIVVLTSRNEGTPVSLIEAMASSKPVVSTDVGGVKEVVGDAGLLVGEDDDGMMADYIMELIGSGSRRRDMGDRGRAAVMEKFSKENMVKGVEKLYESLLIEKGISL